MTKFQQHVVLNVIDKLLSIELDLARAAHFGTLHNASKEEILLLFSRVHDCTTELEKTLFNKKT